MLVQHAQYDTIRYDRRV